MPTDTAAVPRKKPSLPVKITAMAVKSDRKSLPKFLKLLLKRQILPTLHPAKKVALQQPDPVGRLFLKFITSRQV